MNVRALQACVVLVLLCRVLSADVAPPCSYTLTQPDGFVFEARAFGDERAARVETMDGRVIVDVLDNRGLLRWYYAVLDDEGKYVPSRVLVSSDTVPRPFNRARFEAEHRPPADRDPLPVLSEPQSRARVRAAEPHRVFRPLAFLVDFPQRPQQGSRVRYTKDHFVKLLFAEGLDPTSTDPHLPATYTRSVRDYFTDVSSGRFLIEGSADSVIDWTSPRNSYDYYVDGNQGKGLGPHGKARSGAAICVELARAVNGAVDFARFDGNADGIVDVVLIIVRGMDTSGALNEFGSFMDTIFSVSTIDAAAPHDDRGFLLLDDVIIQNIIVTTEQMYEDSFADFERGDCRAIGTICHELGHVLGLPDLYDLAMYTSGEAASGMVTSPGIGQWGLMSYGVWYRQTSPAYPCAWSRARLGWTTPETCATSLTPVALSIPPCEVNDVVYRIPLRPDDPSEYFLLENRRRLGSDQHLPGEGLLIWHVDENFTDLFPGANVVNNIEATLGVNLMQADGNGDLYRDIHAPNTNYGDSGDPFPGSTRKTQFADQTTPGSRAYRYDRDADGRVDVPGNSTVSLASIAADAAGVVSCVATSPAYAAFELGYDAGHYEGSHTHWGENRAGILVEPAVSSHLRSVRTVFRNEPPEHRVNSYTVRVWRGFDNRTRRPGSLVHSHSGVVDWTASDPQRQSGWVSLSIQGSVLCSAGVAYYVEVQYSGPGDIMSYDGGWFTGKLPSQRSYWRSRGTDACLPFEYGDWNLHVVFQEAAPARSP